MRARWAAATHTRTPWSHNQNQPKGLATDGTYLYWANYGDGTINKATLAGESPYAIISEQAQPYGVAVDGTYVYWTTWNYVPGNPGEPGGVYRAPLSGQFANLLVGGESFPTGVTVDSSNVYWASNGGNPIKEAPLGGGTAQVLIDVSGAPAPPYGVAVPAQEFP